MDADQKTRMQDKQEAMRHKQGYDNDSGSKTQIGHAVTFTSPAQAARWHVNAQESSIHTKTGGTSGPLHRDPEPTAQHNSVRNLPNYDQRTKNEYHFREDTSQRPPSSSIPA